MTLIQCELVERRGWLEACDLKVALAFTKPPPGSTVVQVVTVLGWRLGRHAHLPGAGQRADDRRRGACVA